MKLKAAAAVAVVVILVVIVLGVVLKPSPTAWPGTRQCGPLKRCPAVSGINCINYTGECRSGVCVEQLAGNAECAAGWYRESTDANNVKSIASCDYQDPAPVCAWSAPQPCGGVRQACCGAGSCSGTLVCQAMTCQELVTAALRGP
jgi:hypothetical protein